MFNLFLSLSLYLSSFFPCFLRWISFSRHHPQKETFSPFSYSLNLSLSHFSLTLSFCLSFFRHFHSPLHPLFDSTFSFSFCLCLSLSLSLSLSLLALLSAGSNRKSSDAISNHDLAKFHFRAKQNKPKILNWWKCKTVDNWFLNLSKTLFRYYQKRPEIKLSR